MAASALIDAIREIGEPYPWSSGELDYRAGVRLKSGIELPCTLFKASGAALDLAERRILEESEGRGVKIGVRQLLDVYLRRSQVDHAEIVEVYPSRYAISSEVLSTVSGETAMSWTQFVGQMDDGSSWTFGTSYDTAFFEMPNGYSARNIVAARSHGDAGTKVHRELPFFTCFVEGLEDG